MIRGAETWAKRFGSRPALLPESEPGRAITFRELECRVRERMAAYVGAGIGAGDAVVATCRRDADTVLSLLALARLGAALLPVGPGLKQAERRRLADVAGARWAVRGPEVFACEAPRAPLPEGTLVLLPSSGSTGRPKLALLREEYLRARAESFSAALGIDADARVLVVPPLEHSFGLQTLLSCLAAGACLLLPRGVHPRTAARGAGEAGATLMTAPAAFFDWLVRAKDSVRPHLRGLHRALCVASPLPAATHLAFCEAFELPLWHSYGATEAGPLCLNRSGATDGEALALGEPYPGVVIEICDRAGRPLPDGRVGEIVARSPGVVDACRGEPEGGSRLGAGRFFSGDQGVRRDGILCFRGRRKLLIETAGRKVDPVEVERVLRAHPSVLDAAVVAHPGRAREIVKALVVARHGVTPDALAAWCGRSLSDYKVPRLIEFRERLPRDAMGKLRRLELDASDDLPSCLP